MSFGGVAIAFRRGFGSISISFQFSIHCFCQCNGCSNSQLVNGIVMVCTKMMANTMCSVTMITFFFQSMRPTKAAEKKKKTYPPPIVDFCKCCLKGTKMLFEILSVHFLNDQVEQGSHFCEFCAFKHKMLAVVSSDIPMTISSILSAITKDLHSSMLF